MSLYNLLDKYFLLPLGDIFHGSLISKYLKYFQNNDFLSEKDLIDIQNRKLNKLISYCYSSVPYYTKLFNSLGIKPYDIRTREDLCKLPILTKDIIRDNFEDLQSKNYKKRVINASTGGSSGVPLKFRRGIETWSASWAVNFRAWEWYGIKVGDRFFTFGGNSIVGSKKRSLTIKSFFDRFILNTIKEDCSDLSDSAMSVHYERMMACKPRFVRGYPSSLNTLAAYMINNSLKAPSIKAVITTGEVLLDQYRENIKRAFNVDVYDTYGAADGGVAAHECPRHMGLHISEDRCIVEIVDGCGKDVEDGKSGFVISTDLENFAMPFIRYAVGDIAYIKNEKCKCGRGSRLIGKVEGRTGKVIYNKLGVAFSSVIIDNMMFKNMDYHDPIHQELYNRIKQFQVFQDCKGDIFIRIVPKFETMSEAEFDYILQNFTSHFPGSLIDLKFVDEISCLPSGKQNYCISEYKYSNEN